MAKPNLILDMLTLDMLTKVWLLFLAATAALSSSALAIETELPLVSVQQVLEMPSQKAQRAHSVMIEGTVFIVDSTNRRFVFSDGNGYIRVNSSDVASIQTGHRVRLCGVTDGGFPHNVIEASEVELLNEKSELGVAQPIDVGSFHRTAQDLEWVKVIATVEMVVVQELTTRLTCRQGESVLEVYIPDIVGDARLSELVGSQISVSGNLGLDGRRFNGFRLYSSWDFVEINNPSSRPLELPVNSQVNEIWELDNRHHFCTSGQVTFVGFDGCFIEDESGGTWFHFSKPVPDLVPGMQLEVAGYRVGGGVGADLDTRIVTIIETSNLPIPRLSSIEEFANEELESERVRVNGRVTSFQHAEGVSELELENDGREFRVQVLASRQEFDSLELGSAIDLVVTGTCTFATDSSKFDFKICCPSTNDVQVVKRASLLTRQRLTAGLVLAGLALGFCVWWGKSNQLDAKRNSRDLQSMSAQLRSSYDSIRDGIIIVGKDLSILAANPKVREFFGHDLPDGDSLDEFERAMEARLANALFLHRWRRLNRDLTSSNEFTIEVLAPNHRILEVYTSPVIDNQGEAVARHWTFYDVTERQQLQASLLQSQKQEAIGQLAGGIAHDFNNLLTGIIGNLYVAKIDPTKSLREVSEPLEAAEGASRRAAKLVSHLLGFSRKARLEMCVCNINLVLKKMEPLLRPSINSAVELTFQLQQQPPVVLADPVQLEQVLLNICINANDAISGSGEILVRTFEEEINGSSRVVISVRDSGDGIPPEERDKVFEPFFTTKRGSGTGLGLAMSEGIIHQHGGQIEFESEVGVGTEFRVILPVSTTKGIEPSVPLPLEIGSLNGRRILVVDDEAIVRKVMFDVLVAEGASVSCASSGEEAIEKVKHASEDLDLVLLDWSMPGEGGKETLRWLKDWYPNVPVAICSGYVFDYDEILRQAAAVPESVIQKPFTGPRLIHEVKQVIFSTNANFA